MIQVAESSTKLDDTMLCGKGGGGGGGGGKKNKNKKTPAPTPAPTLAATLHTYQCTIYSGDPPIMGLDDCPALEVMEVSCTGDPACVAQCTESGFQQKNLHKSEGRLEK